MLLVLAILRPTGRASRIAAAAVMRRSLLIFCPAVGASQKFIRICIRIQTCMQLVLAILRPAVRACSIDAAANMCRSLLVKRTAMVTKHECIRIGILILT